MYPALLFVDSVKTKEQNILETYLGDDVASVDGWRQGVEGDATNVSARAISK